MRKTPSGKDWGHFTVPYLTKKRMKRVAEFWELTEFQAMFEGDIGTDEEVVNQW